VSRVLQTWQRDYLPISLYFAVECQSYYAPRLHYFPLMDEPLAMVQRATGFQAPLYRVPDLTGYAPSCVCVWAAVVRARARACVCVCVCVRACACVSPLTIQGIGLLMVATQQLELADGDDYLTQPSTLLAVI
jgi:hypothetical protein